MNHEELLEQSERLESSAGAIQDTEVTPSEYTIQQLRNNYLRWFATAVISLSADLEKRFRVQYEGSWTSHKIQKFLDAPLEKSPFYSEQSPLTSYWQYPFQRTFLEPLRAQRLVLLEAKAKQLGQANGSTASSDIMATLDRLFSRFPLVIRQMSQRYNSRPTLNVDNEYDVQDLLHSILHLFFDDIRREETTPSYAGGHSRVDFLLKAEQIVVEAKMTRLGLKANEVGEQLIIDVARYRNHPDCKTLVAFVYDPGNLIDNPRGLEYDLSRTESGMNVKVWIVPK